MPMCGKGGKTVSSFFRPCMLLSRGVKMKSRFGGEAVSARGLGGLSLMGR
jgi:hypothetical protein